MLEPTEVVMRPFASWPASIPGVSNDDELRWLWGPNAHELFVGANGISERDVFGDPIYDGGRVLRFVRP